jgi:PAS domain S-box-containing protein
VHGNGSAPAPVDIQARLAHVFENLSEVLHSMWASVVICDAEGIIEYVNPRFEEVTGYAASRVLGQHVGTISWEPDGALSGSAELARGQRWRGEVKWLDAAGGERWSLSSIQPLRSSNGSIARYIGIYFDITEAKQAELALRESEAYWRALVESAPDHILVVDREGVIQRLNRPPLVAPPEAVIGHSVFEFAEEEYHGALREALCAVFEHSETRTVESRTVGPSGVRHWHSYSIGPVHVNDCVAAAVVVTHNVTERKAAEDRLKRSEEYWRALVENAPAFIVTVDREGTIATVRRAMEGGTPEATVGYTIFAFAAPEAHDEWRDVLRQVFEDGKRLTVENQASQSSGEVRWWSCTVGPVWEGDTVTAAVIVAVDVTERKETDERMHAFATAVPDVIAVMDESGNYIEVLSDSKGALALVPSEDIRGQCVKDFVPPQQAKWVQNFIRRTIETGQPQEAEDRFDLPSGPCWIAGRSAPLTLSDGTPAVVIHAHDITKRKQLELELENLREEIEAHAEKKLPHGAQYGLTFREITVLDLIARGKSDKEIAGLLGLSPFTVNKHSSNVVKKMAASSRSEAVARAVREAII